MSVLQGFKVVQIGDGLAAAGGSRRFAETGAEIVCISATAPDPLACHRNHGKTVVSGDAAARAAIEAADLIVCEGRPSELHARQSDPGALRRINPFATIVTI